MRMIIFISIRPVEWPIPISSSRKKFLRKTTIESDNHARMGTCLHILKRFFWMPCTHIKGYLHHFDNILLFLVWNKTRNSIAIFPRAEPKRFVFFEFHLFSERIIISNVRSNIILILQRIKQMRKKTFTQNIPQPESLR